MQFSQVADVSIQLYRCTTWTLSKRIEKKAWQQFRKDATSYIKYIPQNSSCTATNLLSRRASKLDEEDMQGTAGGARTNSLATFSYGHLHTDEKVLDNQLDIIFNCSVRTQDVAWKTYRKRWTIEMDGEREKEREREFGKSVRAVRHDIYIYIYIYVCMCVCVCVYIYICVCVCVCVCDYLTAPHEQGVTQSIFKRSLEGFPFRRPVAIPWLNSQVYPTIYL